CSILRAASSSTPTSRWITPPKFSKSSIPVPRRTRHDRIRGRMITRTLEELAAALGGQVLGDGSTVICGVAGIREAMPGDITFLANSRYESHLFDTSASAVICSRDARRAALPLLLVDNPYLAFQRVVRIFRPDPY